MIVPKPNLRTSFSSLRHRNFKLWFFGQLASLIGTWMQTTALGFLSYELTRSSAFLGYVGFANGIPTLIFTLVGGVYSDRFNRRSILVATQWSMMFIALVLTGLSFLQSVKPWHLIVLSIFNGIANAFDAPARQSFVRELVPREDLPNALALNAMMFNTALAVGPAIGGLLYAFFGPAVCFGLNALSFLPVIIALFMMNLEKQPYRQATSSAIHDMVTGFHYIANHSIIRSLLFIVAVTNIVGMGYVALLPAWSVSILHGNSTTLGILQSSRGIGASLGALMIAALGRFQSKGKLLMIGLFLYPFFLCLFSVTTSLTLSIVFLFLTGWWFIVVLNMSNTLIQSHVDDNFRGRVMSVYSLALLGMIPIGSLIFGSVAELTTEQFAVLSGTFLGFLFALIVTVVLPFIRTLS